MRISKRKINLYKYAGPHKIWIKPYRTKMRTMLRYNCSSYSNMYDQTDKYKTIRIPKYRITVRNGKWFVHYFSNHIPTKVHYK